jgi:dynein heavy chain
MLSRNYIRLYPALINFTTIDWFKEWPREALLEVANKYLANVNILDTISEVSTDILK